MANDNLKRMLEISRRIEDKPVQEQRTTAQPKRTVSASSPRIRSQHDLESQIKQLDEQIYGAYQPEQDTKYDPQKEMKQLKEMFEKGGDMLPNLANSKLPSYIKESFMRNPCNINPETYEDPKMKALQERISGKKEGLKSVIGIQKKLDAEDKKRQQLSEQLTPKENITEGTIDYNRLEEMISRILDEKLSNISENVSHSSNNTIKAMTFKNGKFLFLDEDNNLYECAMTYKGKNKKNS